MLNFHRNYNKKNIPTSAIHHKRTEYDHPFVCHILTLLRRVHQLKCSGIIHKRII